MELSIGQNVNLTQEAPDLDHVLVGLRWRTDEPLLRESLEAGVLLTSNGKLVSRQDFVFAHQVLDRAGSVRRRELMGDDQVQFFGGDMLLALALQPHQAEQQAGGRIEQPHHRCRAPC